MQWINVNLEDTTKDLTITLNVKVEYSDGELDILDVLVNDAEVILDSVDMDKLHNYIIGEVQDGFVHLEE